MNMVGIRIKKSENFGYYQADQRRYQIKMKVTNMTKEQATKLEAAIRKACASIQPLRKEGQ